MAALPYMPLYVADYLADAAHLTTQEHGAYLILIMTYWQRGNALPDDDNKLCRIARLSPDEWDAMRDTIAEFFDIRDGGWHHRRIERELSAVREKSAKARTAGKASSERRGNGRSTGVEQTLNGRSTDVQRTFNHTDTDTEKKDGGGGGSAGAREAPAISPEAFAIVDEVLVAASLDSEHPLAIGGAYQVQTWVNEGIPPEVIRIACKRALAGKRDGPPKSWRYFRDAVAREHALAADPLPVITVDPSKPGTVYARDSRNVETSLVAAGRRRIEELQRIRDGLGSGAGGENPVGLSDGHPHVRLLPAAGRG